MSYAEVVRADAPAGYWRMGESGGALADSSGNARTATLTAGAPGYGSPALIDDPDKAILFDGASYFSVPAWAITETITIEAWFRRTDVAATHGMLSFGAGGPLIYLPAGGAVEVWVGAASKLCHSSQLITDLTTRHHLVYVKNGNTSTLYIDGNDVTVADTPAQNVAGNRPLTLGFEPTSATYWAGALDEAAVYGAALSYARVQEHWRAGVEAPEPATSVAVVEVRAAGPPYGMLFQCHPASLKYGFQLRSVQTASFLLPRSDASWRWLKDMLEGRPPMITVRRPDGLLPYVGFVSKVHFDPVDPYVRIQLADHGWKLSSPNGARTTKSATYSAASGTIVKDLMRDMDGRAEPPLDVLLDSVDDGPAANYQVRADYGLTVLEALAKQTDMEWGWAHEVTPEAVKTSLLWRSRLGTDRRHEEIWREGKQLASGSYDLDFAAGIAAAVAVGGSGSFAARPAAAVSVSGTANDIAGAGGSVARIAVKGPGLGGTRVLYPTERVTEDAALTGAARQTFGDPHQAAETVTISVLESAVDMSRFGLGDIRTIDLATAVPQAPVVLDVRVTAIGMDPAAKVHAITTQVLR